MRKKMGARVLIAAGATDCSVPTYSFWLLPPNSNTWQSVQPYPAPNYFTFNTAGLAPGPYRIGV